MPFDLEVLSDATAVAEATADLLASAAAAGGHVALAGGSTPKHAYELVSQRGIDLSHATLWFSDERAVAPADERSNFRMAAESLLDRLPEAHRPRVHRIEGELGPDAAAERYAALVEAELGPQPVFDLVMLGLGPDGHVASLFPGKPALSVTDRLVVGVPEPGLEPFVPRVTFTFPLIDAAHSVLIVVAGEGKADAVRRAFGDPPDYAAPGGRVRSATVLLDEAAASGLDG